MRPGPLLLLIATLCCACGPKSRVNYVRRQKGVDGAWEASLDDRIVALDATGSVATLQFEGRTFVLRGLHEFHGFVATDRVDLTSGKTRLWITPEAIWVESPWGRLKQDMSGIPPGQRVVYEMGKLWME